MTSKEKRRQAKKRYYEKHREKILAKAREAAELRKDFPDKIKQYRETQRRYLREHYPQRMLSAIKYSAKRRNLPFNLELTDIVIPETCPKTGIKLCVYEDTLKHMDTPSVDRIIPELGYVKGNIQIVCFWYNVAKLCWTEAEVYQMCRNVVEHG